MFKKTWKLWWSIIIVSKVKFWCDFVCWVKKFSFIKKTWKWLWWNFIILWKVMLWCCFVVLSYFLPMLMVKVWVCGWFYFASRGRYNKFVLLFAPFFSWLYFIFLFSLTFWLFMHRFFYFWMTCCFAFIFQFMINK